MLWPDDLSGSAGLESCSDTIGTDMALCVVESRGEEDSVEKQPDAPGGVNACENPRFVVRQRDAQGNVLGGIDEPIDIGREYRTSREEMSISPTKGTSPRSAATPAPRERRHEAATKSDTAPGSASPVSTSTRYEPPPL